MIWILLLIASAIAYVFIHQKVYKPWRDKLMRRKILNILANAEQNEGRLVERVRGYWKVPDVYRLLREMESEELIKSEPSRGGRPPKIYSITDKGLEQIKQLPLAK